jgi:hypothetical protein
MVDRAVAGKRAVPAPRPDPCIALVTTGGTGGSGNRATARFGGWTEPPTRVYFTPESKHH